jgi:hypothetical protein
MKLICPRSLLSPLPQKAMTLNAGFLLLIEALINDTQNISKITIPAFDKIFLLSIGTDFFLINV